MNLGPVGEHNQKMMEEVPGNEMKKWIYYEVAKNRGRNNRTLAYVEDSYIALIPAPTKNGEKGKNTTFFKTA